MSDLSQFTGVVWGYARVSTEDQSLDLQIDALKRAGVDERFIRCEKKSGRSMDRPELQKLLRMAAKGDCIVVWKLDRLGRSLRGVLEMIDTFKEMGIHFRTIQEGAIDTTTPMGNVVLAIFAAVAQLESDLASERTKAGLEAARKRGRMPGRKHYILNYPKRLKLFTELWKEGAIPDGWMSAKEIVRAMNEIDKKAPQIKSHASYTNWKSKGFPGFERPEMKEGSS